MRVNWTKKKKILIKTKAKTNKEKDIIGSSWPWLPCPSFNFWPQQVWTPNLSFGTPSINRKKECSENTDEGSPVWHFTNNWFSFFQQVLNTISLFGTPMLITWSTRSVVIPPPWSESSQSKIRPRLQVWILREISEFGTSRNSTASSTVLFSFRSNWKQRRKIEIPPSTHDLHSKTS